MTGSIDGKESNAGSVRAGVMSLLRAPLRVWLWRLFPYVFATGVIALLAHRYSVNEIYREMSRGNSLPLIPIAICTYALSLLFVALSDTIVLRCLLSPAEQPSYGALIRGKAATVLLHIVHYALGQGAYATWLARKTGLRVARVTGILLYVVAAELCSVCVYATIVIAIGHPHVPPLVPVLAGVLSVALISAMLLLPFVSRWLSSFTVLDPWLCIPRSRALLQIFTRLPQHMTTSFGTWLAARAFGLEIPLWVMLSYVPVLLIVASLPINVAGFGAVQGTWLLLSPWARPEHILAFSVIWQLVTCAALIVRGLPFVRGALTDIRQGAPARPQNESPPPYANARGGAEQAAGYRHPLDSAAEG